MNHFKHLKRQGGDRNPTQATTKASPQGTPTPWLAVKNPWTTGLHRGHNWLVMGVYRSTKERARRQSFYLRKEWKRLSRLIRAKDPLCVLCHVRPSTCVDHVDPNWNTWKEFMTGPFQALCRPCHQGKTNEEIMERGKAELFKERTFNIG